MSRSQGWALQVYGTGDNDLRCRMLVWHVRPQERRWLLNMKKKFDKLKRGEPSLRRIAFTSLDDLQWVDDNKVDVFEQVPDFEDMESPIKVDGLYDKKLPEHDTDHDLVYVCEKEFYFRMSIADLAEWYEASMKWEVLEAMFQ